ALVWLVVAGVMLVLAGVSWSFTRHYQDPAESESLVTAVTVLGLTFCLFVLTLAPLDIFLVSSTVDQATGLKQAWATPEYIDGFQTTLSIWLVSGCFAGIVLLCFVVIPYAYFYFEELDHDEPAQRVCTRRAPIYPRSVGAAKYTTFTVCIAIILLVSGMVLRPKLSGENPHMDFEWFKRLLLANGGVKAIMFVVAVLILAGMMVYVSYTAYGLAVLPVRLLRGQYVRRQTRAELDASIERVRQRRRAIQRKYENATRPISASDGKDDGARSMSHAFMRSPSQLARQQALAGEGGHGWASVPVRFIRSIEVVAGKPIHDATINANHRCMPVHTCSSVDKVKHSICGRDCGYIIEHPEWFNPVNVMFLSLSHYFPADYLFMVGLVLYVFAATTTGLVQAGVRFFWVFLYRIKAHRTAPQGLLLAAILLMVSLLALNYTTTTVVAPQYAQFGSQRYCNHTLADGQRDCSQYPNLIVPCSAGNSRLTRVSRCVEVCTPTVLSTFIYRIAVSLPTMGLLFFNAQWLFLSVFALGFLYCIVRGAILRGHRADALEEGEEE
ncbi:hypothetical protein SYNPS1DRAFT_6861, partial [Syncephalis pseudoplumigaleata]